MLQRNIDFIAVLFIALVMLGFAQISSWHIPNGLDSMQIGNAVYVDQCPISSVVLSNLGSIFR